MAGGNKGGSLQSKLKGDIISIPAKASLAMIRGTLVMVDATGFAIQGADTAGCLFIGVAEEAISAVQATASSGTVGIRCRRRGIFKMKLATTAAAPTLNGSKVFIDTAQTASVDELVDIAANVTNFVYVGKIVKHGTDAEALAGSNSTEVWVDIMGLQSHSLDASYNTAAEMLAYSATPGADLVGTENAIGSGVGFGSSITLSDALEALVANGHISVPLTSLLDADGDPYAKGTTGPGFQVLSSEELALVFCDGGVGTGVASVNVALPSDVDGTADITVSIVTLKSADTAAATIDLTAFAPATGAASGSAADCCSTTIITMSRDQNVQVNDFTLANASLPAAPRTVTLLIAGASTTDDLYILGVSLKYSRKLN